MSVSCFVLLASLALTSTQVLAQDNSSSTEAPVVEPCVISNIEDVEDIVKRCTNILISNIQVPANTTLNLQLLPNARITMNGIVSFGNSVDWMGPLIKVTGTGILFDARQGTFSGNGALYWDGLGVWGKPKPPFFDIEANSSVFYALNIENAPQEFIYLHDSDSITISWSTFNNMRANPESQGRNSGYSTNGVVVVNSNNVLITDTGVYNQDDCVTIKSGQNITVSNMYCYGGLGFAISVGHSNDSFLLNTVRNVTIRDSTLTNSQNAIQVKTLVEGGEGIIEDITIRDIQFTGQSAYGVIVQQNYKDLPPRSRDPAFAPKGNIPIKNLDMAFVTGDFRYNPTCIPVYIKCAEGACVDWEWHAVDARSGYLPSECNYEPKGFVCD